MYDLFSALPAPLPLHILLKLPDLKALYAAILSSPQLNAVFRLNARNIFKTIVARSLPDELASPILTYMLLRERLATDDTFTELTSEQLHATINDAFNFAGTNSWPDVSNWTIFHTIAQAVRIHDIAFFILRSKLDYLGTLKFEKLANPRYRYKRPYSATQIPEGVPLDVHMPLSDPRWMEETRAIRVLWLLAAGWRASQTITASSAVAVEDLTESRRMFFGLEDQSALEMASEVVQSMLKGPALRPPHASNQMGTYTCNVLETYAIRPLTHADDYSISDQLPTSPQYSWTPAVAPDLSSKDATRWGETIFCLLRENPELSRIRVFRNRSDSPLQLSRLDIFHCLGFGFWDRRRTCNELGVRTRPYNVLSGPTQFEGSSSDENRPSMSDHMFRLYKIYKQQEQREEQGWHR